ncbi:hypothetical protein K502DRAFT_353953 [Neoconidiobolus thromboides FSU 785]|nr:hypothetical protein K502DRAFT_353953 [Neoconidiobolus thromboides FSU 785]
MNFLSGLKETGKQKSVSNTIINYIFVYSFDQCKSFGFNTNRNQYDYSKISSCEI